jgi:outer membrane immunogenic protein
MMKYLVAAVLSSAALTAATAAQAQSPGTWNGIYIGAHAGYGWSSLDGQLTYNDPVNFPGITASDVFANVNQSIDGDGWFGGAQIGFNYLSSGVLWGLETDVSWTGMDGSGTFTNIPGDMTWTISNDIDAFGTIRARFGFLANPSTLLYLTGGAAWGKIESDQVVAYPPFAPTDLGAVASASETKWGWTIGGGAEWAFDNNWSFKAEYLYVDLGSVDNAFRGTNFVADPPIPHTTDSFPADLDFHTIRVGLNYRFGGREEPAPVPLK